jgi:CheY-like chemotaxis protein
VIQPARAGLWILLAEPSVVIQKLAAASLEGEGNAVTVVNNGAAALDAASID